MTKVTSRFGAIALGVALVSGALSHAIAQETPAAAHQTQHGPESVANLAESLMDAVVNISITQNTKAEGDEGVPTPNLPKDAPFQDLFDDYFKKRNDEGANTARKVTSLGSGFVIDPSGFIVTNNHVIEGASEIVVNFANGGKLTAKLVGTDTKTDIALLKVEPKKPLKYVKLGDSRKMRIGDWVMAIGNPFGLGGSVSVGIVSARNRNLNAGPYDNFLQTDAAINRGNSGGPLFNMFGDVIGINTAIYSPSGGGSVGIGFAVPTEIAAHVVAQLREFGDVHRGWLGVRIQPVTDDMIADLKLETPRGALISGIVKGGPVEKGPIVAGDVILKFNGLDILEMRDLPRVVADSPLDKPLDVVVIRKGEQLTLKVTLSRQPAEDKKSDAEKLAEQLENNGLAKPEGIDPVDPKDAKPKTAPITPAETLGLTLSPLTAENRKEFSIPENVEGVLVLDVPANTAAHEKGIRKGDVIVEIAQDFVESPEDVAGKITELKADDRRNAYLMVANQKGELRLVAVPIE
ncbi:Do family serine endopeptidase [Rhizobium sp. TH2]|uniref:Do family serine endopeptidase n=1 Tax=Rhizobium sp. TH2 TaxID=2775403 RepID=UPI002157E6CE|nr:Do family serine endopeptidase [Rhizobium sp. TH2]UVC06720.1 Do family serine endopeptidase [Rhizobium sp. TH2]